MHLSLLQRLEAAHTAALLGQVLAMAADAIVVADAGHRIVLFNDGAAKVFGHAPDAVIGQALDVLIPQRWHGAHTSAMEAFAKSSLASRRMGDRREIKGLRADGTHFDAEASIVHLEFDGQVYFAAILRDVSEQRRAAQAIAESESRFRRLAANAPVGIFTADAVGRCVYVNTRWCDIAGMDEASALDRSWIDGVHPDDRAATECEWKASLQRGAEFNGRYRYLWPGGHEVWVLCNVVPNRDADGRVQGYLGSITDFTETHRQAEALEKAQVASEAAASAKTMFLANMSHETRTPLNAVIGMSSLLLGTPLSEEQGEYARTIHSSARNLLDLINDILDVTKADAGKLEIERISFSLRNIIEESLELVAPRAAEKGLNLAYLIEDGTPETVVGDAARLRQILVNLLSNAVKFTHQGGVFVAVECARPAEHQCRLSFAVHDTGIGIANEHLPRLFQAFTQVDASTTRKYGGTGLGLAITKRLVELMGGEVSVQSRVGEGSVFRASVKLQTMADPQKDPIWKTVPLLAHRRVLIVDDETINRRALSRMAMACGMEPMSVATPFEALDLVRKGERFDLAVLDAQAMRLRDAAWVDAVNPSGPLHIPTLVLAHLGQRQALEDELLRRRGAVLTKPIKLRELHAAVVRLLTENALAPELPRTHGGAEMPAVESLAARLPLRILVAEDNLVNQRVMQRMLERLGYAAQMASNGLEVIDAVELEIFDVVLMDIHMPEIDGLQAARWIHERWPASVRPRIVAMTANAWTADRARYQQAGIDAFLPKPVDLTSLELTLLQVAAPTRAKRTDSTPGGLGCVDQARIAHLRELQGADHPRLLQDLIDLFIEDSPRHLGAIDRAIASANMPQLREHAHRFLSATQNIGATHQSDLCMELEIAARSERLDHARTLLRAITQEQGRVLAALHALKEQV